MKTKGVRLYGKEDLRLEEFELPAMKDDEILAEVISDSICMSSYKAAQQGASHKRVPNNIDKNPTLVGHEFSGRILEVGKKWRHRFSVGAQFSIQPALNYKGSLDAPGYSYQYIGGDATFILIPNEVMEMNCLLEFSGDGYFPASLSEPMSCIAGAFNATYHTEPGSYQHLMGIKEGGTMALLAGVGPMGLGAIDWALHGKRRPSLLVITDIDPDRLARAEALFPPSEAAKDGVRLLFCNTRDIDKVPETLRELTDGRGYDDVFVFAPVKPVVETGDQILGRNGCLNFFAGPTNAEFSANFNFYNVHYIGTHIVGTSGGNTEDMIEALDLMSTDAITPAVMITHVGGLNAVVNTTLNLPKIPGGKKLIYTHIDLDLTPIDEFEARGEEDPLFRELARLVKANNGLWSVEAEKYLLAQAKPIT